MRWGLGRTPYISCSPASPLSTPWYRDLESSHQKKKIDLVCGKEVFPLTPKH